MTGHGAMTSQFFFFLFLFFFFFARTGTHVRARTSIKKDEKKIRSTAAVSFNKTAKRVVTSRNKVMVRMESALSLWISDCRKNNIEKNKIIKIKKKFFFKYI